LSSKTFSKWALVKWISNFSNSYLLGCRSQIVQRLISGIKKDLTEDENQLYQVKMQNL
jgi:hypothetical protein